ncbi:hypothetical protein FDA52_04800 [Clostridium botulinum]|uniref:Uncharacterized protein n=1 Tax=Clostridium botulinum TaxID=1491 RepID=A0A140C2R2_CLOBO|nr:hypothetical protein [Clostridium botulinum]ALT05650.1 hypothetical protein [Clostridium botulinum]ALT05752.1 hypothetical protein [Clostridium botulinum]ALT05854.1 hypothetical protein [Clostridium botulinum]NFI52289.1 hypothetical protein [Clostridium botulinum]HBJ2623054.1 hypothetical protein [Clostridium botulinum]
MNFLFGAIMLDFIANGNKETSEAGAGLLTSLGLTIYLMFKLPKIEEYILHISIGNKDLLIVLTISFTILIPIYWSHFNKYKSLAISILLRVILYIDVFCGISIMVIINNKLGAHLASFMFNIDKVSIAAHSDKLFLSLISFLLYIVIKILDFIFIIGLIPGLQILFYMLFNRVKKKLLNNN